MHCKPKHYSYSDHFFYYKIIGRNDNPTTEEFKGIYRRLLVCKEIVYKNDYANCITNDTGVLTVSSGMSTKKSIVVETSTASTTFEMEFDYHEAIYEESEKFDQHLRAYTACTIECEIIKIIKKGCKKECSQCIAVFHENTLANDEFVMMKQSTDAAFKIPCLSTVHIIIASDKIFQILESKSIEMSTTQAYNNILRRIMNFLPIEELYTESDFNLHNQENETSYQLSHKEKFIYKIVSKIICI